MSFRATLTVEGKKFNVLQSNHILTQKYERGRTTSGVQGGRIILILEGTEDELLGSWATGPTVTKDGDITYDRTDQQSTLQKLEFEGAYATMYFEFMSSQFISAEAVLDSVIATMNLDMTKENEYNMRILTNTKTLVNFAHRTRNSNCILLRLTASKIKLDGIDHENT